MMEFVSRLLVTVMVLVFTILLIVLCWKFVETLPTATNHFAPPTLIPPFTSSPRP